MWYPLFEHQVTQVGAFSSTADGACEVHLDDGQTAYLKPKPGAPRPDLLVREKIAADLAHMLGLPVAPVVIRAADPNGGWPDETCLSLSCLKSGRPWADGGAKHLAAAAEALEALRVFWTWIGDDDHNDHGQNLVFEVHGGHCAMVAFDHAYSMGHRDPTNPLALGASSGYGTGKMPQCVAVRDRMVTEILSLDWSSVENTVRRLELVLTDEDQTNILALLMTRRDKLTNLLGA